MNETNDAGKKKNILDKYTTPLAIVFAGVLISGALYYGGDTVSKKVDSEKKIANKEITKPSGSIEKMRPIDSKDHIRGNPNAMVKIVEYSDLECPFCKRFHGTMKKIMKEYGDSGKVAWVYRHFPLDQLHPQNARKVAVASECVVEQGGNKMFWKFTDRYFELTPSNDNTNLSIILPKIYKELRIDEAKMKECISSGKYDKHIQDDIDNAITTGGRGTPWSIVISPNGKKYPLSGSQAYNSVRQLVEIALKTK